MPLSANGLKDATTDLARVDQWWQQTWPGANVGIRTGAGLLVLDVDGEEGAESLHELERSHGVLPHTIQVVTGGGGAHYWFKCGEPIRNSAGRLGSGLDIRCEAGYVVAPPSRHESGRRYEWENGPDETPLALAPEWLLERLRESNRSTTAAKVGDVIPKGRRNAELTRIAGAMRRQGATEIEILAALRTANETRCEEPLPEQDVERIAASVSRYEPAREQRPARRGRKRYTFAELLELPEPDWLIRGVLPEKVLAVLYGAPGSGKTFASIDWALHVATGQRWLGHDVRRKPVAYIVAEGVGGWPRRARAWRDEHGGVGPGQFSALAPGVNLLDREDTAKLREELRALPEPPALVVIDTLARCLIGGDENSARDVGQAIVALDELREEFDATVLVVHHTAKGEEAEERGSSALRGAADTMHKLRWDEDRLLLSCEKQKDAAEAPDVELELEPREHSCVLVRSVGRSGPTPSEARLISTLLGFGEDGASTTALMDAAGLPKTTFYRTLNGLVDTGDVEKLKQGNRTQYIARVHVESRGSKESHKQAGPRDPDQPSPTVGGTGQGRGTTPGTGEVPTKGWDL